MDLSRLIKMILPSLIPLLAFVAVDALFGETVGLVVGVAVGIVDFAVALVRDKKPDPFIAADTLLLALAGGLSLAMRNEIFFKLKPAVIELVLGASLGLLLALPPKYLKAYMERQLRGVEFSEASLPAMKKSLGIMLAVLGLHAGLTIYAALALSTAAWGFISGVLLYLLFAAMVLGEYLLARLHAKREASALGAAYGVPRAGAPGEELLPLIDGEGKIVGSAPRSACHKGPGMLHPVVHLEILDGRGGVYLQKRAATKLVAPGRWDSSVGGHVRAGEGLDEALARELREELGVTAMSLAAASESSAFPVRPEPVLRYKWETELESELVFVYVMRYEGPFAPDRAEVEEGRFWAQAELAEARGKGILTDCFEREYGMLVEAYARAAMPPVGPAADPASPD